MSVSIVDRADLVGKERGTNSEERSSEGNSEKMIERKNGRGTRTLCNVC